MRKLNYCWFFCTCFLTTSVFTQPPLSTASLLYEISGKGLKKSSYLFGTIHIYDPNIVQIPQEVFDCLQKTSTLVLEILPKEMEAEKELLMSGFISSYQDSTLSTLLSEKAYQNLLSFPNIKMMGENINLFIPLFAYQLLFFDNAWKSVEQNLTEQAEMMKKKSLSLETVVEQIKTLQSISIKDQIAELEYWMGKENPQKTLKQLMQSLFSAYAHQTIEEFMDNIEYTKLLMDSSPQLVSERDLKMADKIDSLLTTPDNFFIAVGALHLQNNTDKKGIVNILKQKGYTLTPVKINLAKK